MRPLAFFNQLTREKTERASKRETCLGPSYLHN
jgi:hypothetical protein